MIGATDTGVTFDPPFGRRVGDDFAFEVEQVDLDARVDHHQGVEDVLEPRLVDLAVDEQHVRRHEIGGEVPIEPLIDLLLVLPLDVECKEHPDGADEDHQAEQDSDQLSVQSS